MTDRRPLLSIPRRTWPIPILVGALVLSNVPLAIAGDAQVTKAAGAESEDAEPASPDADRLRELYARGQAAFDAGSYKSAIEAFEAAYLISEDPTLLFNIALCYDRLENYDAALQYLDRYAAQAPQSEQGDIERRRSSLEIRRERALREEAEPPSPAEPVDPAPPETSVDPVDTGSDRPPADAANQRLMSPAAWTLTAVAAAGFGAGIGLGVASLTRGDRAECEELGGETYCTRVGADDARASRNLAIGADVAIGVGAVATIAVIAIVATRAAKRRKASNMAWAPSLSPNFAGGSWTARF